jgi:hypothetical protein
MCSKLKEEGLQCPSFPIACWHIDEKTRPPIGVDIKKPPQLEGKTCPLGTNHDKNYLPPKPQLVATPQERTTHETKST